MEIPSRQDRDMNAAAQSDLREFASLKWPKLNHKGRMRELQRLLPWTARRVRSVYNQEAGAALRADERADIAEITGEASALRRSQATYRDLEARIAALEALLQSREAERDSRVMDGRGARASGRSHGAAGRGH